MNPFDRSFQPGSPFLLWLGGLLTGFFVAVALLTPEHRYLALFFVLLGLMGTWRHHQRAQQLHEQRGMRLLEPSS